MHKLMMVRRLFWKLFKALRFRMRHFSPGVGWVVVVPGGVGRSGTNMLMSCFHKSSYTETYFENDSILYDNFHIRSDRELLALYNKSRAPFFIFKALLESHRITDFQEMFPGIKSIWIYRRVEDMVNSHLKNWPGHREYIDQIVRDRKAGGYRSRRMSDETYDLIRSLYKSECSEEDCAALFWLIRNRLFFEQALDVHPDSLLFCYEKFVSEPEIHIRRLCAHTHMPYNSALHDHIHAKSVSKNTPPKIDQAILNECNKLYQDFENVEQLHAQRVSLNCS